VRDLSTGKAVEPEPEERVAELVRFVREVVREMGDERATGFLRKFYGWYLRGSAFGKQARRELMELDSPSKVETHLLERWPGALPQLELLEATVRYPDDTDRVIELPISAFGGG
jgi:tRNA-dihydrouridine synthase